MMQLNLDGALQTFIVESRELLEAMEQALLDAEQPGDKGDMINSVFRAAHTIKGSAGLFGLDHIVAFTHVVESVLDRVRDGEIAIEGQLVALLLACCDHIGLQVTGLQSGLAEGSEALSARGEPLRAQLTQFLGTPQQASVAEEARQTGAAHSGQWLIAVRFGRDVLRNGMDPLSFLHYLRTLGTISSVNTLAEALPAAADMDPEACYLALEIGFTSGAELAAIEGVFEFVRDDCELRIDAVPNPAQPAAPAPTAASAPAARPQERQSVRVDAERLDRLIDLVGELIIASASANLAARRTESAELQENTSVLAGLVQEVRDSALQLRMVKIGATFKRFQRVVHDVAREAGKEIQLEVSGEDAELDKTVVEKIADPAHPSGAQRDRPRHRSGRAAHRTRQARHRHGAPERLPRLRQHRDRSQRRRRRPETRQDPGQGRRTWPDRAGARIERP
jgi:two-component system chemotaxis sensor kinase CheA